MSSMHALKSASSSALLSIEDYIAHQARIGVFAEDAPFPELDPRVQTAYHALVREEYPQDGVAGVHLFMGRYGFYRDWIDDERPGLNCALSTPLVDICIGAASEDFVRDLPALREAVLSDGRDIVLSDSFSFLNGYGDLGAHRDDALLRLHSPVAKIDGTFEAYVESLTTERRKKYRRMIADFEKTPLRFELTSDPYSAGELDFIRENLAVKWGSEAGYAFRQTLWGVAVQTYRPEQCLMMRVYDGGHLVFIQSMIVKGAKVYCQAITKDEQKFFSGLAAFTDFECIKALCGKYQVFDPSCRTSLSDPESIGIAKRATVNMNQIKPLLAIGQVFPPEDLPAIKSRAVLGKEA